ncbi:MAG: hypothetical protein U5N86_13935 [Planctomycetota bacterium]|nr:hypothetical protein [Planctomycetota bacterium]
MKRLSVFAVLVSMFALSMACGSSGGGGIEFADFALKMNMAALDDVIVTADGHYLTAGDTHDDDSVVVAKVGPDGTLIWQKILDLDGFRVKLAEVSDGYLLFCALEIPANGDDNDAVMFKLDYDGEIVWEKHYTNGRYDEFRDIYVVGDRIFALMLIQTGPDWFDQETYLAEFDSNGNPVSGKTVDIDAGVDDNCSFNEIVSDGTSTYIAGAVYLDGDGRYLIIAKLNESYEVEWCKYFGTGEDCYAEGLTLHPDGGVVFCAGILGFGAGDYDGFVAHFDADGTIQWQMTYGTQSYDDVMATAFLSDGTMMIAGYTEGTPNSEAAIFIAKLRMNSTLTSGRTFTAMQTFGTSSEASQS